MTMTIVDFIVEEPSMEVFLRSVLPKLLGNIHFNIYSFRGKHQLLEQLPSRLQGYAGWISKDQQIDQKIVVLVDQDTEDCEKLKAKLEQMALNADLATRSQQDGEQFTVINRIVIEELEAWYFGDWQAVQEAYPRVSSTIPRQARYKNPDAIRGGTWECFERIMQRAGYFKSGLRKSAAARSIGQFIEPDKNQSHSFQVFRDALREMIGR